MNDIMSVHKLIQGKWVIVEDLEKGTGMKVASSPVDRYLFMR